LTFEHDLDSVTASQISRSKVIKFER